MYLIKINVTEELGIGRNTKPIANNIFSDKVLKTFP